MSLPAPLPGTMIRYSFLWSREARTGATEGSKDRPCAVVVAVPADTDGTTRVVVVPVTHAMPTDPRAAVALPSVVKAVLGLDDEPSWICLDELNVFAWPGYDLRPVPRTGRYEYGVLPEELFRQVRDGIVALSRARRVRQVTRD